jgi:hypothetical protein
VVEVINYYWSAFFVIGILVVIAYARQRFNEPSFPHQEKLPQTIDPLQYFFLRREYKKARLTYIGVSLLLYGLLVLPGPKILSSFGIKDFPPETWALVVALVLVGLVPNFKIRWLGMIEDALRRSVHAWFLVPDGIVETIRLLEDARYDPPKSQLDLLPVPLRKAAQENLEHSANSLEYRWARVTMLVASLESMGAGAAHPLKQASFAPFEKDFEIIRDRYEMLARDVGPFLESNSDDPASGTKKQSSTRSVDSLLKQVNSLLKQVYEYISWGVRHQADSEEDVDQILRRLGFDVPIVAHRRFSEIVIPAVLVVAGITMVFWIGVQMVSWMLRPEQAGSSQIDIIAIVKSSVASAAAASLMYGGAVYIALSRRSIQIGQKDWSQKSFRNLIPIAVRAGMLTWLVIVAVTVIANPGLTFDSLSRSWLLIRSLVGSGEPDWSAANGWAFLPTKMATALPWFLAGAAVSAVVARLLGGNMQQSNRSRRVYEAFVLGSWLGVAVALAQLMQISYAPSPASIPPEKVDEFMLSQIKDVPIISLAGFLCGAVIGFVVPHAYRANLASPPNRNLARALRGLLDRAEALLGSNSAAADWVFTPHADLDGITPAEAIQHKSLATGVGRLLEDERFDKTSGAARDVRDRQTHTVIKGGKP